MSMRQTSSLPMIAVTAGVSALVTVAVVGSISNNFWWRWVAHRYRRAVRRAREDKTCHLQLMLDGQSYECDEPILKAMRDAAHDLANEFNRACLPSLRQSILQQLLFLDKDDNAYIEPPFYCDYGANITVGKQFYANFGCVFLDCARITIGNNVFLAPGVQLYTAAHPLNYLDRRTLEFAKPISIGDDVWIGGSAIVLPGVTIGSRVVVAAGAVVTKDVPDDVLVAGVPAQIIRKL